MPKVVYATMPLYITKPEAQHMWHGMDTWAVFEARLGARTCIQRDSLVVVFVTCF